MLWDKIKSDAKKMKALETALGVILAVAVIGAFYGIVKLIMASGAYTPNYDNDGNEINMPDWITVDLLPKNEYSRPGDKTDKIVGIVIHYVGNPGSSAAANRNYFAGLANSGATYASSNFIVGLNGEIIECVPLGEIAYCSNNRNHDTISIECCHPDADGKFTDETYESLVRLCRFLIDVYGITPENIIRHYDVTGKMCPLYYVENEEAWTSIIEDIYAQS